MLIRRAQTVVLAALFLLATHDASGGAVVRPPGADATTAAPANPKAAASPVPGHTTTLREYVRVVERPYLRVGLTVTVVDRQGKPARGLTQADFRVLEDGDEFALADFGLEGERRDRPLSVAVLLDFSYSMGGQVKKVREAAQALVSSLRPGDEIMRVLTIITTLFMPLTLIVGIYGMNFQDMPEFQWRRGYLFVYGLMIVVAVAMYYVFRRRGIFRGPGR